MASVIIFVAQTRSLLRNSPSLSVLYTLAWTEAVGFGVLDTHGLFCIFVRVHAPWGSALYVDRAC